MTSDNADITSPDDKAGALFRRLAPEGTPPPWETLADFAPALGAEVRHGLGAIMSRAGLDLRTREIATVCILAALGGCEPQLTFHIGGALRAGAAPAEIIEALTQVSLYAGFPRTLNALTVARQVFADHGIEDLHLASGAAPDKSEP
jgi:4-carboxymuconolactone decarboxylase